MPIAVAEILLLGVVSVEGNEGRSCERRVPESGLVRHRFRKNVLTALIVLDIKLE